MRPELPTFDPVKSTALEFERKLKLRTKIPGVTYGKLPRKAGYFSLLKAKISRVAKAIRLSQS